MRIVLALSLVACGDNITPDSGATTSGARLKLVVFDFEDGTRQLASTTELFDAERAEPCTIVRWSDGLAYCTPAAAPGFYTDDACTVEVGVVTGADPDPAYVMHQFFVGGAFLPSKLFAAGAPTTEPLHLFEKRGELCAQRATLPLPGDRYLTLGAEIAKSDLVHVTRRELEDDDPIGVLVDESADGLQLPAALVDRARGEPCSLADEADADHARCVPSVDTVALDYRDAACSEPVLRVDIGTSVPEIVATPGGACLAFRPVGGSINSPSVYRELAGSCTEMPLPTTTQVRELGPELAIPELARIRRDSDRRIAVIDDGAVVDRFVFDHALGVDCAVDGESCIPHTVPALVRFRDPACQDQVVVGQEPIDSCGPPGRFARRDGDVFPIVGVSPIVYEVITADVCKESSLAGFRYVELGPRVDTLARATRTVDQ